MKSTHIFEASRVFESLRNPDEFSANMKSVFILKSPELYFSAIDQCLMLISFYLSLWVVNFAYSASSLPYISERIMWSFVSLLPVFFSFGVFAYVVRSSYVLKSVCYRDSDIVAEMEEEVRTFTFSSPYIYFLIPIHLLSHPHTFTFSSPYIYFLIPTIYLHYF
jgi:hypothetical protein